jgi:predicted ribonuclease YlaK
MASNHHTDQVFKEKRKPKNPIKFKITLNEEQKEAKSKILENTITLLAGSAGSGKTLLACQIALEKLFMRWSYRNSPSFIYARKNIPRFSRDCR